jgi:hypothetical protein
MIINNSNGKAAVIDTPVSNMAFIGFAYMVNQCPLATHEFYPCPSSTRFIVKIMHFSRGTV